jgi:uracil-DNA glycosylase
MNFLNPKSIESSWYKHLKDEFTKDYFIKLNKFLVKEEKSKNIYPNKDDVFNALNLTPLKKLKVVIIGQDPYHGLGQAHGLCFSVQDDIKLPPSLRNIYIELADDMQVNEAPNGNLSKWAKQGVLLLNNVLTVEESKAGSHHKKGWEQFTDKIIEIINEEKENIVFILWGNSAQKKAKKVSSEKNYIIESVHPSPLSSYRGYFKSKPFSKTNKYLAKNGIKEINWQL